jgi:hypothetical protein
MKQLDGLFLSVGASHRFPRAVSFVYESSGASHTFLHSYGMIPYHDHFDHHVRESAAISQCLVAKGFGVFCICHHKEFFKRRYLLFPQYERTISPVRHSLIPPAVRFGR